MSIPQPPRPGDRVGRFQLQRLIGHGGQASVWQAHDPQLEREVALKLLHAGSGGDEQQTRHWLQEARSVSRLAHPNIVPVFEAGVHQGLPYLVFEYVPGTTLAERVQRQGALPPQQAVALMLEVLDGLAAAHAAGIVHRDLKPSNVLVDAAGRARVMDFGIAARLGDGVAAASSGGTPGYMSPEAARGEAPTPAMDVFSAAVVLVELLSGRRLIDEPDPQQALRRVLQQDLSLPPTLDAAVDDALRAVLLRGLARDAARRYPTAQALRAALHDWLHPPTLPPADTGSGAAVEFLLRRMQRRTDFPALSGTIARIQSISSSDRESVATLTNEILKDVALTQKLLRLVNTPHYARGGTVSTVSRAVTLVGFNGIRNMALSLVLLEHMQDQAHAALLKDEFLRSLLAGAIAAELSSVPAQREQAFLAAMFQNLGRLLAEYYFPEEARAVRGLMAGRPPLSEAQAAAQVLGVGYEQLGLAISRAWNLPEEIRACMRALRITPFPKAEPA